MLLFACMYDMPTTNRHSTAATAGLIYEMHFLRLAVCGTQGVVGIYLSIL